MSPTNGYEPSNPTVTSIDLTGYAGYGNPTDTSTTTYDVDCGGEESDIDVLVD